MTTTGRIQPLLPSTVSAFRAGITLLGSFEQVVLELLANSCDAGATKALLEVSLGSLSISLVDNGAGINPEDLPLVAKRHYTSKSLHNGASLGFRGEALAAISEISSLKVLTRSSKSDEVYLKKIVFGHEECCGQAPLREWTLPLKAGVVYGTLVHVESLFHNRPILRKNLQSQSRVSAVSEAVKGFSLANPHMAIDLTVTDANGHRDVAVLSASSNILGRISMLWGPAIAQSMLDSGELSIHTGNNHSVRRVATLRCLVSGLSGWPQSEDYQKVIFGGRNMTNDRALLQAARETIASIVGKDIYQPAKASRGLKRKYHQDQKQHTILSAHPAVLIIVSPLTADNVDILSSPAKTVVHVSYERALCESIQEAIRRALSNDRAYEKIVIASERRCGGENASAKGTVKGKRKLKARCWSAPPLRWMNARSYTEKSVSCLRDAPRRTRDDAVMAKTSKRFNICPPPAPLLRSPPTLPTRKITKAGSRPEGGKAVAPLRTADLRTHVSLALSGEVTREDLREMKVVGQLDRKFIVTSTSTGIYVLDQHAVSERIVLEAHLRILGHRMPPFDDARPDKELPLSSRVPFIRSMATEAFVDCNQKIIATWRKYASVCHTWGFCANEVSPCLLHLRRIPVVHENALNVEDFRALLHELDTAATTSTTPNCILRPIQAKACRSAIKFGDELTLTEMEDMLRSLRACKFPFQCAHGRPSIVPLTKLYSIRNLQRGAINSVC